MLRSILKSSVATLIIACFILSWFAQADASAPKLMSYQGRATDVSGNPVTDGLHTVRFDLFDNAAAGSSLWNETAAVTTSGGLFTHTLGSVTPILESQFRYYEGLWLQVTFDGQVQTPRTQFTSVGYAFHVQSVHNAEGGNIKNYVAIYDPYTDGEIAGLMADGAGSSQLWLRGGDVDQSYRDVKLDAATGRLQVIDRTAGYDTANYGVSSIKLAENALEVNPAGMGITGEFFINGANEIWLNAKVAGNSSVYLPNNAISKSEILDEPGVAQGVADAAVPLQFITFTDITTVTITTPASGYILLFGKTWIRGGPELSVGLQIDETSGGGQIDINTSFGGIRAEYASTGDVLATTHHVYYKATGTYTFRLEGLKFVGSSEANAKSSLLALFVPTSYGTVETLVPSSEADQFEGVETMIGNNGEQFHKVDLRELELRAAKAEAEAERARADAERAQRELLRAKYESSEEKKR